MADGCSWQCVWMLVLVVTGGWGVGKIDEYGTKMQGRKIHIRETRHEGQISGCNTLSRNAGAIIICPWLLSPSAHPLH